MILFDAILYPPRVDANIRKAYIFACHLSDRKCTQQNFDKNYFGMDRP